MTRGNVLQVNGLQELADDRRAILSLAVELMAQDYPVLTYRIGSWQQGTHVYLFWRNADNPGEIFRTGLYRAQGERATLDLAAVDDWRGTITEVGIDIYGDLPNGEPLQITSLSFQPFSRQELLRVVRSQWSAFPGWTQNSINHLPGRAEGAIASQAAAAAAWAGCALLLLGIAFLLQKRIDTTSAVIAVLIPWIGLDLAWQRQLSVQVTETKATFSGKSVHEKHLASGDGALYQYARYLKEEVLPEPGQRIFLLHDSKGHNFWRLRAQYHLLPHNIHNFWKYPDQTYVRTGDYLLVLGEVPWLKFHPDKQLLRWGPKRLLQVQHLDRHELGDVYRVVGLMLAQASGPDEPGPGGIGGSP
ncbi:MAG: hypothetical protein R3228_02545 [Halioglobus sp.]|nr:hypothetical protein [Halioglobus sp.]